MCRTPSGWSCEPAGNLSKISCLVLVKARIVYENVFVYNECSENVFAPCKSVKVEFEGGYYYVTSVDGETIWCTGADCLPPRGDDAEAMDVESDPVWAVHSAMIDCALPWQLGNNASIINTAYQNYFPLAVNGEMTAAEFLQAAQDQANQEIANAG